MTNLVALLFGMAVVIFFSYERFNRTTDDVGKQLQRLVSLLSPDKLRSRRVVLNAYGFYAATFVLIYFFLCAYAELLPALGGPDLTVGASKLPASPEVRAVVAGFTPANSSADFLDALWKQPLSSSTRAHSPSADILIDSSTSLAVALLIVGLAPSFPILQKFEIWMRGAAHRLAGIPTRVLQIRDELRTKAFDIGDKPATDSPSDALLIPRGDWARLAWYRAKASREPNSPDEFFSDLKLVFAVSAWVLDGRLRLVNRQDRERFAELEQSLKERKEALVERLDGKTGFSATRASGKQKKEEAPAPEEKQTPDESKSFTWDRLSRELSDLAEDMCILLALYTEHEIIIAGVAQSLVDEDDLEDRRRPAAKDTSSAQRPAREKLEAFLGEYLAGPVGPARSRSYTMITALWTFFVVIGLAIGWSVFPGARETELRSSAPADAYWRLFDYGSSAVMIYFVPVVVALAIRDGWKQFYLWRNMRLSNWTIVVPQGAFIFIASWAIAAIFFLATAMWQAGVAEGWSANIENPWTTLRSVFAYNAPAPLRGAVLALIIVVLLDTWRSRSKTALSRITVGDSITWGLGTALLLGLVGGLTRWMSVWAGALQASVPRQSLDAIDRGLIAYTAIYSALIAFCVVFSVAEVLRNQRRPTVVVAGG